MNRAVKLTLLALAGVLVIGFIVYRIIDAAKPPAPKKQPVPLVRVAQAQRQDITYQLEYDGDVIPILQANVFSKVAGSLDAIYTDMGKVVRAGQMIALIDTTEAYQNEEQAAAAYYSAKTTESRTRTLVEKKLAAAQDLDNAVATLRSAEANYNATRIRLDYAKIRAPFHGYVTKRFLDPGAVVSTNTNVASSAVGGAPTSNSTIFTIMDIDTVKIDVNVLDRDIPQLSGVKNAVITLSTLPGREFHGVVSRTAQAINTTTRTMQVEILIPNHDEAIKPGSFAHVSLNLGEHKNALTVPAETVLQDKDGAYVLIAQDTIAKRQPVKTGVTNNGRLEILSGLDGSEQVIVTGQTFAKPNGKIKIVRTDTTSNANRTPDSTSKQ